MMPTPENPAGSEPQRTCVECPADAPEETRPGDVPRAGTPLPSDPFATLPGAPLLPSLGRFGSYQLLECIATGGMGVVYRAEELSPDRLVCLRVVALKRILRERLGTHGAVERFQRETQAAKKLDHPGIVPVFESGVHEGEHYFTMPFVSAGSLQQYVVREEENAPPPLTPRQAARLIRQVADAVGYAHEQGVIHRDIKPQNILLQPRVSLVGDDSGDDSTLPLTPRLSDFGLARLVTEESGLSLSQKGEAMGTPGYMPPEQACGRLQDIGPASDVYGLGAVLYALLTGRPPFPLDPPAPVLETIRQVVDESPYRPGALVPGVPPELEDICLKCLKKDPARRYPSAAQLAEALDDFLEGRSSIRHTPRRAGWPVRTLRRLGRSLRRHPLRTAYLVASLAAMVALVVVLGMLRSDSRRRAELLFTEAQDAVALADEAYGRGDRRITLEQLALAREKYTELIRRPQHLDLFALRLARAEVHSRRGAVLRRDPGEREQAREELETARHELEELAQLQPGDPERRRLLAEVYHGLGVLCWSEQTSTKLHEGLAHYRQALPIRQQLRREFPDSPRYLRDLARNHGFMGDTQLDLGDEAGARASYAAAAALREEIIGLVARESRAARLDALCQRARDFGNRGNYLEWTGRPGEALEEYQRQLDYYRTSPLLAGRLPGEFWIDRANCLVTVADLRLNLGPGAGSPFPLLQQALEEYHRLAADLGGSPRNRDLESATAWALLVRGKARLVQGDGAGARADLEKGRETLEGLLTAGPPQPDDLFRLAAAQAWLGRLAEPRLQAVQNTRAMDRLKEAVQRGFNHLPQLQRERGFSVLRTAEEWRDEYARLIAQLRRARQPAGSAR